MKNIEKKECSVITSGMITLYGMLDGKIVLWGPQDYDGEIRDAYSIYNIADANISDIGKGIYVFFGESFRMEYAYRFRIRGYFFIHILLPSTGKILYDGKDLSVLKSEYRNVLGFMLQQQEMYKNFTMVDYRKYCSTDK